MVGTSNMDQGFSKVQMKKDVKEETDCGRDDKWLNKWSEFEDVKEKADFASEDGWLKKWYEFEHVKEEVKVANSTKMDKLSEIEESNATEKEKSKIEVKANLNLGQRALKATQAQTSHKINSSIVKLCKNAPTSEEVRNFCQFKCKECDKLLLCWWSLKNHVRAYHNSNVPMRDVEELLEIPLSHICKVCMEPTLCDLFFIRRHVKSHQLNIDQYVKKFNLTSKKTPCVKNMSTNIIGNYCTYKCKICGEEFNSRYSVTKHQWNLHRRKIRCSESLVKRVYHKCKICEVSLLCDKLNIMQHLKRKHEISLREYCKLSNCILAENKIHRISIELLSTYELSETMGNLCEFTCKECTKIFHSSGAFKTHVYSHHQEKTFSLLPAMTKGFSYKCKVCSCLILCDIRIIQQHMSKTHGIHSDHNKIEYNKLCRSFVAATPASSWIWPKTSVKINLIPVHELSSKIGNLCIYRCPKCDANNFNSWGNFEYHFRKKHSKWLVFSPKLVITARCHSCLVCPTAVLSDRYFLKGHLRRKHKMSLMTYQKIFQRNGGEVLPTMREWMTIK